MDKEKEKMFLLLLNKRSDCLKKVEEIDEKLEELLKEYWQNKDNKIKKNKDKSMVSSPKKEQIRG